MLRATTRRLPVWISACRVVAPSVPFGGYKASGQGRELSLHGIDEFLETKQVHINLNEAPIGWY